VTAPAGPDGRTTGRGGTGGSAGTGGSTAGRGGSTAGTGGSTAGRGGTGGATAGTTGTAGTGGATAGTTGSAGTGGTGGGLPCPGLGTFDTTDMMGFGFNTYMDPARALRQPGGHGGRHAGNAGLQRDGGRSGAGLAEGGSAVHRLQTVRRHPEDLQRHDAAAWTGYKLHVRVKVTGGNPSALNPMGIQPYVNTGATYNGYCGKYNNLVTGGGWNDYVLDLSTCTAPADPSMIIALGV
jgi:hypothetical protein